VSAAKKPVEEIVTTECPRCGKPVTFRWCDGFIAEPHNVLIASSVLHAACWDEIVEEAQTESDVGED
jgi:hypothetical protein